MQREPWHPLPEDFRILGAQERRAVLLETAKRSSHTDKSLLFLNPKEELVAWHACELERLLQEVDERLAQGAFLAGYFNYECGEHFVGLAPVSAAPTQPNEPIAWLGVFDRPIQFNHRAGTIDGVLPSVLKTPRESEPASVLPSGMQMPIADYKVAIARVQEYLQAGHSYQVNFTDRVLGRMLGTPLSLYQSLLMSQPVPFAAYVNGPAGAILSLSPEMFYRTAHGRITVRPMKGTWRRGVNLDTDVEAEHDLLNDEKNRSEHVTIVDLLRNDVGRICKPGSVKVDKLFSIERYNTLLQMTSTISGSLMKALTSSHVFRNLFPSGSITGAPKRRTMEIIRELESHPRGIYTGAIGYFGPDGEACFNVAIRTLATKDQQFTLGVGGGITADSNAEDEYEECRLKSAFLTNKRPQFSLIETMRCMGGILLLSLHIHRLAHSARYFGIEYDVLALHAQLTEAAARCGNTESRIRLELHQNGEWKISTSPLETIAWNGRLLLAKENTDSRDIFLHHKTTNRSPYDCGLIEAQQAGFDEMLYVNEHSQITEGAISSIFLRKGDRFFTPSLRCGVLPGVQRAVVLQQLADTEETKLEIEDLRQADEIFVCNALRGIRPVASIETIEGQTIWRDRNLGSLLYRSDRNCEDAATLELEPPQPGSMQQSRK